MSLGSRLKKLERTRAERGGRACAECGGKGHVELVYEGTPPIGGPCPACGQVMRVEYRVEGALNSPDSATGMRRSESK